MQSDKPKVLHDLNGRPMIGYIVDVLADLEFGSAAPKPVYVVGYRAEDVEREVGDAGVFAIQVDQLGTGHAASIGLEALPRAVDRVLLIHGDEPMIEAETYREMLDLQASTGAVIVLLTGNVSDAHELGRVVRDLSGRIEGLVQQKELTPEQADILEINFGAYVIDRSFMEQSLPRLSKHPGGEYYLTDLVYFAVQSGRAVEAVFVPFPDDQMGINDAEQLARAEAFLRRKAKSSVAS